MNSDQIGGIARALAAAVGGYLVGQGLLDESAVATLAGAVSTIVVAVWSVLSKRK